MEIVYFYESNIEKQVKELLNKDEFMRLSFTIKIGGNGNKIGYNIYIIGNQEEIENIERKFNSIDVDRVSKEDEIKIIKKFKEEAENAACGIGLIFG